MKKVMKNMFSLAVCKPSQATIFFQNHWWLESSDPFKKRWTLDAKM